MKTTVVRNRLNLRTVLYLSMALVFIVSLGFPVLRVTAANPPPAQVYYVTLPEDDLLTLFDDNQITLTTYPQVISPIRSVTSIAMNVAGTLVYWDQWEDGGYESDIANPGANIYNAGTNPDGTQVWGDGDLTNGCPPAMASGPNPCASAGDDQFSAGDVIILDNDVVIEGTTPGPYTRSSAKIFYDGRDKVGTTSPVAMTRAAFPPTPGSVMAGGSEMFDTSQWGTSYMAPVGEDTVEPNNSSFEDVRWFIMAGAGGATIDVDANGDGDVADANDLNDFVLAEGGRVQVNGIFDGGTLTVVAGHSVQVNSMTADIDDTFEFRWDALVARPNWTNDYLTPVGTSRTGTAGSNGCTEIWLYNPNPAQITVSYDAPGGNTYPTADGSFTVPANSAGASPNVTGLLENNNGARFWTAGGQVFSPISITDCTQENSNGRLMDWGAPLVPTNQLTREVLVGWAPGCSNESHSGICHDPDSTANGTTPDITANRYSRNVVFVSALTATNIYVDTNGSGLTCSPGTPPTITGAEQSQVGATPLTSYRFDDDPPSRSYVHDLFTTQSYARDDSVDGWAGNQTWTGDWTEGGGETPTAANAGAIQVNITAPGTLRLQNDGTNNESGRWIQRTHNISGATYARLSFELYSSSGLDATDRIAVEISTNGTTWTTLKTYGGPWAQVFPGPNFPVSEVFNISAYIANPTYIRFRIVDDLETGNYWAVDHVHIDYATGGDFDMSGAYIKTFNSDCSGSPIAVAYGQYPSLTGGNDDEALDLGTLVPPYRAVAEVGSIGNYVWLDEDGDGDQDAGESGIPNARVTLTGTAFDGTTYTLVTYTDANGGYLFTGLKTGSYTVTVDQTSLPAGLAANPTYDENGIGTPHTTTFTLAPGQEHMTADFGYNWSSPTETNTNTGTGAIGDRVWVDVNGDGLQQGNEIGIPGIQVLLTNLGPDGILGTGDDTTQTTTTDNNGNYIFDNLPAGAYTVVVNNGTTPTGFTQTGDPDAMLDNQTTSPILLGPGDVYLNADFGYQPEPGTTGSIGDTLWVDLNRNNTQNAGEPLISGVTVSLIKDLNGNGVWDVGEPVVATDITDESGTYGFSGLPVLDGAGTDDYLVWVNDSDSVLGELVPTYDVADGANQGNPTTGVVTGLKISAVSNLTTAPVTNADFAFAPPGHDAGEGLIGDTIFFDQDNDGVYDPGEGMEGVTVTLIASDGRIVAETTTDENGQYYFGGLAAGTYTVNVVTTTLPGVGLVNTVDPDGGTPNVSTVTIAAGASNLLQDFGYRDPTNPNSVGGTIWEDTDSDGTQDAGETNVFSGISVDLYTDTNGNGILDGADELIATTMTDSTGHYLFSGLPDGNYFVDVTDDDNELLGYWHSLGTQGEADDGQSKVDPYRINLSGGETRDTVDFGYFIEPAALGNFIWDDVDGDGIQDAGESGIPGVTVTLLIAYPNGSTTVITTVTDASGYYSFENLLLDEDYDGVGTGEPVLTVTATKPVGYTYVSPPHIGTNPDLDSGDPLGEIATVTRGLVNVTYDFGFSNKPTAVRLESFTAVRINRRVELRWVTAIEDDILGFNIYRSTWLKGKKEQINKRLIVSKALPGSLTGAEYLFKNWNTDVTRKYVYWLEVVDISGNKTIVNYVIVKPSMSFQPIGSK